MLNGKAIITFEQLDKGEEERSCVCRVDDAKAERVDRLDPALQFGGGGWIDGSRLKGAARVRELYRGQPVVMQQSEQLLEQLLQVRLRNQLRHGLTGSTRVETDTEKAQHL